MGFWICSDVAPRKCALHAGIVWLLLSGMTLSIFIGSYKEIFQLQKCLRRDLLMAMAFYGTLTTINVIASLLVILAVLRRSLGLIRSAVVALTFTMIFSCIFFSFVSVVMLITQRTVIFRLTAIFVTGVCFLLHVLIHASVREYQGLLKLEPPTDNVVTFSWRKTTEA